MLNFKEEICSIMQKRLKENQECTNGDYFEGETTRDLISQLN